MNIDYPEGATPLDPDEASGLIPTHIVNHGQLNEWELGIRGVAPPHISHGRRNAFT
jgi:hypothetical protein